MAEGGVVIPFDPRTGGGLARTPRQTDPTEGAPALNLRPTSATPARRPRSELEEIRSSPLRNAGLMLEAFGAGIRGQQPMFERLREQEMEERRQAIADFATSLALLEQVNTLMDTQVPASQQDRVRGELEDFIRENAPSGFEGIADSLNAFRETGTTPPSLEATTALFPELRGIMRDAPPAMQREFFARLMQSPEFFQRVAEAEDRAALPDLRASREDVLKIARAHGIDPTTMTGREFVEALEPHLPDGEGGLRDRILKRDGVIERHPELYGTQTPKLAEFEAKEEIKAKHREPPKPDRGIKTIDLIMFNEAGAVVDERTEVVETDSDRARVRQLIAEGYREAPESQITGTRKDVLGAVGRKEAEQAGALAREGTGRIVSASSLLGRLQEMGPRVTGVTGTAAETIGGLLGQLNADLGASATELIAGASPEELAEIRERSRGIVAQSISEITGELSGRFTEAERQLTERALRLTEPTASFAQVMGGLETLLMLSLVVQDRQLRVAGVPIEEDLETPEGLRAMAERLSSLGLGTSRGAETLEMIRNQRRELKRAGLKTQ